MNANIFESIKHIDENDANEVHYKMGKDIRNFIKSQGGTMPEKIPTPDKSLKEIEKEKKEIISTNKI